MMVVKKEMIGFAKYSLSNNNSIISHFNKGGFSTAQRAGWFAKQNHHRAVMMIITSTTATNKNNENIRRQVVKYTPKSIRNIKVEARKEKEKNKNKAKRKEKRNGAP